MPASSFFQDFLLLFFRAEPADHFDAHGKRGEPPLESLVMLEGQDGGRREHGDLLGISDALNAARMATSVLP